MRHPQPMQRAAILGLVTAALWTATVSPLRAQPVGAGTVKTVSGSVIVQKGAASIAAKPGLELQSTDTVKTGADSTVGITLRDNTVLSAGANSVLRLDAFAYDNKTQQGELQATLKRGSLSVISGALAKTSPDKVQFKTSTMTLGVRGTNFIIEAEDRGN